MAQVIMMSKEYRKRPSEILGLDDEYIAYCIDEVAFHLLSEATEKDGKLNWNKFRWKNSENKTNKDLMEFIRQHS